MSSKVDNWVMETQTPEAPSTSQFTDAVDFLFEQIQFLKRHDPFFSINKACSSQRKLSPALVSLILQRKRKLNLDRVEEISHAFRLNSMQKLWLKRKIQDQDRNPVSNWIENPQQTPVKRKEASAHLLTDPLNLYVKDCFLMLKFQKNPQLVFEYLFGLASRKRIERSLAFLIKEGYLRKNTEGHLVLETDLTVTESPLPSHKIRKFHRQALAIARDGIEKFSVQERLANTFLVALSPSRYQEAVSLIAEFNEKILALAEKDDGASDRVFQLLINLCPTGGRIE